MLSKSGAFCRSSGAPSSTTYQTWTTGRAKGGGEPRDLRDDAVPLAIVSRATLAERAVATDRVVLHVLDDERDHGAATPDWRTCMRSA
jgi:hypothetical protein